MTIVDTSVWVDYLRGTATPETTWLELELTQQRLGITDLILPELLQGIKDERSFNAVQRELLKLAVFRTGGTGFRRRGSEELSEAEGSRPHGAAYHGLPHRTFCLQNGHSLLHNDRDFDAFEEVLDLLVVHP